MKMWALLEIIVLAAIVLISITEFFLPLLMGKPLFGSFRKTNLKNKKESGKADAESPLEEKLHKTKEKVEEVVEEVKEVQNEATKNFKTAKDLKKESDDLLK